MSDDFLDNQEITAEDLNNIAIDLGSADFSHFQNGVPTAVSELNRITADLVSPGVLLKDNRCAVGVVDNKITVDTGVIVFNNGAKKRITEMQTLDLIEGTTNYVYAMNDVENNIIKLENSSVKPVDGDYILLARISTTLEVSEAAETCKANVLLTVDNSIKKIEYNEDWPHNSRRLVCSLTKDEFDSIKYLLVRKKQQNGNGLILERVQINNAYDADIISRYHNFEFINENQQIKLYVSRMSSEYHSYACEFIFIF